MYRRPGKKVPAAIKIKWIIAVLEPEVCGARAEITEGITRINSGQVRNRCFNTELLASNDTMAQDVSDF